MNFVKQARSHAAGARAVLAGLVAALIVCVTTAAQAQTVSYQTPMVTRPTPSGGTDPRMQNQNTLYYISHDDCVNNQAFVFPMSLSTTAGFQIFGSESADCSSTTSRGALLGTGPEYCNELPQHYNPTTGDLTIYAQDLVYGVMFTDCDGNSTSGTTSSSSSSSSSGFGGGTTFSSSSGISSSGTLTTGVNVQIFFTFDTNSDTSCLPSSSTTATSSSGSSTTGSMMGICASWVTQVFLVPPTPPTGLSLGYGDGELIVDIPSTSAVNSSGGYYIFCAPFTPPTTVPDAGSDAGKSDGGTSSSSSSSSASSSGATTSSSSSSSSSASSTASSSTASSSTASTSTTAGAGGAGFGGAGGAGGVGGAGGAGSGNMNLCPTGTTFPVDISQPNVYSLALQPYICAGPVQYSATQVNLMQLPGDAGPFVDMTTYVVGVSAFDEVYNVGPPSQLMCAAPQQTNTFLKTYCTDGGPGCAGCGSCNVGANDDSLWPMFGLGALGWVAVIVRKDRKRRRRRAGIG